jgi:dihydrofolate reductase
MTSRDLAPRDGGDLRFASGDVRPVFQAMTAAAGGKDLWLVGGGDLAGQFAEAGLLDEVVVSVAPVTLGAGRPLLPRRLDLELVESAVNGAFVSTRYRVAGPLLEDRA